MATYDEDLLQAADDLVRRGTGRRGEVSRAKIRRSISTSYYALFHFLLDEAGLLIVGSTDALRRRRRVFARCFTHTGLRNALDRVKGRVIDGSVDELFRSDAGAGTPSPPFAQTLSHAFLDAYVQRNDADYDLNKVPDEEDARLLIARVRTAVQAWRDASSPTDRDFKHALCLLMLLKGRLRQD